MQACTDPDALDAWLARALTAVHVDAIFPGPVGDNAGEDAGENDPAR